jgi:hypothetical protein
MRCSWRERRGVAALAVGTVLTRPTIISAGDQR